MKKQVCPLSGIPCDNRKCYHISEIENNREVESLDLCNGCVEHYLNFKNDPKKFESDVIKTSEDLLDAIFGKPQLVIPPPCPKCKISAEEVTNLGKLGCPGCYEHFRDELLIVVQNYHNSTKHVGKKPKSSLLKEKLAEAIEKENYEEASRIKKLLNPEEQ
jgi:protein arginine kinase activator